MKLTNNQFKLLSELLYRKTGIYLDEKKLYSFSIKIKKRMDILEINEVDEYIRYLRFLDKKGEELQHLINLSTVNETYFFRDFSQLLIFAEYCIDEIVEKKNISKDRSFNIWSAGCSIGCEPYTLAIILLEMFDDIHLWDVKILASDIDLNVLDFAKKAEYTPRSVKDVPPGYLVKYFRKTKEGNYQLINKVKDMVKFVHLNLSDKYKVRKLRGFDTIFCRNVLIYFDNISRKQVVNHFYTSLNDGGYIFLSSTESIGRVTTAFKLKKVEHEGDRYLLYCKEKQK